MDSNPPHKAQLPARAPEKSEVFAKLAGLWRPEKLHLAFLAGPWSRGAKIGAALVGVAVLLLGAANLILSGDWVESRVAARIKEKTGRDLTVNGSTLLLFTPGPYVVISDATVTDPDNEAGTDLSIGKLKINLDFADLFSPTIEPEQITLVRPVLTVRLGEEDELIKRADVAPKPLIEQFAKAQAASPAPGIDKDLHLKDVRIEDGTVVLVRDETTEDRRIEGINARLTMPELRDPLIGRGSFDWKKQNVDFSFEVRRPADLKAERHARLQVAVDTKAIAARFDGRMATSPAFSGKGMLSAKARSIPSMLAWMREDRDISSALGDGELASKLSWSSSEVSLKDARFALEHASGQGEAVISLLRPRPHVRAALALDHLDLTPFMESTKTSHPPSAREMDDNPPAPPPALRGSKDWFAAPAAQHEQAEVEQEIVPPPSPKPSELQTETLGLVTPTETTPVAAPAAFDADVNLNVRKTRAGRLGIGPSSLSLTFRDGVVDARLGGMELYGGRGRGTLTVDANTPVTVFDGEFRFDDVDTEPLLKDAAQFDMLSGRTKLNLTISGAGEDADAIVSSLQGEGNILVTDGAIRGIDITAFIRALGEGNLDLQKGEHAKTAFSDLGGGFTLSDGIVETQNLNMLSPLLKVSAEGTVDLAHSNIDILAQPEIVASAEGRSGANSFAGLSVPVRIEGPLDHPSIQPQIGSLFANPGNASQTVNKIGEALQRNPSRRPVGEAIGRLLGGVQIGDTGVPQALAPAEPDQGDAGMGDSELSR